MKYMESMNNRLVCEFPSREHNESLARGIAAFFIMPLNPRVEDLSDVKTAVSEAVTNAVIHGYRRSDGLVRLELVLEGRVLTVTVKDSGEGIADIKKAREPMFTTQPEAERSGMGFTIMESFMDELSVESRLGYGTSVTMKKLL